MTSDSKESILFSMLFLGFVYTSKGKYTFKDAVRNYGVFFVCSGDSILPSPLVFRI